ncbi:Aste57867_1185 [Aphanomyces stellatus]|uniref:Aste57867_1185 protein n=1 Tax=Aphanomyces stellatus TaxID=120398 RepID=A0A485K9P2_9STRA|nr:hypothetical protein As57867_001184 [Aphanomyces stellatus]VFT78405.1 Aste57867_1185 [Aphanomyces stellatus]
MTNNTVPYLVAQQPLQAASIEATFDFYVLSQSWQPYFCTTGNNWPGCANPTDFMSTQLTLHGLWPNKNSGANPADCGGPTLTQDDINKAGADDIAQYWPDVKTGGWTFVSNEWDKHGTCSGLDAVSYLQAAISTIKTIGTPSIIASNVGNSVAASAIRAAYGTNNVALVCKGSDHALSEVRTCYDKAFNQMACPSSLLKQDNCGKNGQSVSIYSFN